MVFKRILVPVDFSAGSDHALQHAAALALAYQARVLPLHVTPPICFTADCGYGPVNHAVPDANLLRQTRTRLQRLMHRFVPAELAEEVTVRSGEPIEQNYDCSEGVEGRFDYRACPRCARQRFATSEAYS